MNATVGRLIAHRIATSLGILLLVSLIVFLATSLLPGDVAQEALGQSATPEMVKAMRETLGLDRPPHTRYLSWLGGLLTGDPGKSLVNGLPVAELIGKRLPNSLLLAGLTAAISVPLALVLGISAAMRQGSRYDRIASITTISIVSVPEFLIATIAVLVFAVSLRWLPALSTVSDSQSFLQLLRSLAMPVLTLTCVVVAQMARLTRAAVVNTLREPYIEMAILKGAGPARTVIAHALPNAVGPIANAVALSLSSLLGGVVVVETIFNYPGLARLMVDAVSTRDIPVVQTCAMIFSAGYLLLVTIADVLAIVSNPRLR
ncbi:MAG: ABC transporter permease [Sphingomonadales bacterium]|nr:ABC transporter permease [Sphingomonadales bacterium]